MITNKMELRNFEQQINAFLWFSLITVTAFLLEKLLNVFKLWAKAHSIPGPPTHSFYGHSRLISHSNLPDTLYKCHGKYGSIVKLWLGPTQLVVSITDTELVKEVMENAVDKLPLTGKAFRLAFGESSLFVSSFEKVEHRRKLLQAKLGGALLERVSLVPEGILKRIFERNESVMVEEGLDCETISQQLAFTILGCMLFGDVFMSWPKASEYEGLLMKISKDACYWASYSVTPFWKQEFWEYQELCAKLKCLTQELVIECKRMYKSMFLWDISVDQEMGCEPCGEIISLMFHGTLTVAALIGGILTRLVTHLDVQDKIHSEIITAQKILRKTDQLKTDLMPHLLATVYESARLLTAGHLLQRCSLKYDLNLKNGTVIPAGAMIVVPVQLVQMDRSNWGKDAGKFDPSRFLSRMDDGSKLDGKVSLNGEYVGACVIQEPNNHGGFLPFGSGPRACIGQKLAITGISSLFTAILKNYEVKLQPGTESSPKPTMNNCIQQLLPTAKIMFLQRGD